MGYLKSHIINTPLGVVSRNYWSDSQYSKPAKTPGIKIRRKKLSRHEKHLFQQRLDYKSRFQKGMTEPMGAGVPMSGATVESPGTKQGTAL